MEHINKRGYYKPKKKNVVKLQKFIETKTIERDEVREKF